MKERERKQLSSLPSASREVSGVINYSYFGFDKLPRRRRRIRSGTEKIPQQTTTNLDGSGNKKKASGVLQRQILYAERPAAKL